MTEQPESVLTGEASTKRAKTRRGTGKPPRFPSRDPAYKAAQWQRKLERKRRMMAACVGKRVVIEVCENPDRKTGPGWAYRGTYLGLVERKPTRPSGPEWMALLRMVDNGDTKVIAVSIGRIRNFLVAA